MSNELGTSAHAAGLHGWLKRVFGPFLLCVAVWLVVLGVFNVRHPSDWALGDWLINYSGGFVRRGLIGEAALLLRDRLGVPLFGSVLALQWALYAVVLVGVWRRVRTLRWSWWLAAAVFSPATLAFVLQDPPFAFRKEILLFALVVLVLGVAREEARASVARRVGTVLLLVAGCAVCVLAHEGLLVFFPYLFAAVWLRTRCVRQAAVLFAPAAAVSLVLFWVVSQFPGDGEVAWQVCRSIGGQLTVPPSGICGGAIDYLMHDAVYAHAEVQRVVLAGGVRPHVPFLFALPLLPLLMGVASFWRSSPAVFRCLLLCAAVAWTMSISVFYYGTDWTRWVYIHCFCLLLLLLAAEGQRQAAGGGAVQVGVLSLGSRLGAAMLLVYALGWQLTMYAPRPLYGSFFRFVLHMGRHPAA